MPAFPVIPICRTSSNSVHKIYKYFPGLFCDSLITFFFISYRLILTTLHGCRSMIQQQTVSKMLLKCIKMCLQRNETLHCSRMTSLSFVSWKKMNMQSHCLEVALTVLKASTILKNFTWYLGYKHFFPSLWINIYKLLHPRNYKLIKMLQLSN